VKITCVLSPPIPEFDDYIVVVIDVLRLSSTLSVILNSNPKKLLLFDDYQNAVEQKQFNPKTISLSDDSNNSLSETYSFKSTSTCQFISRNLKGKEIAFSSTNGSNTVIKAVDALGKVYITSLLNLTATAETLANEVLYHKKNLAVICSGVNGNVAVDDLYVAGLLIHKTIHISRIRGFELDDGASIAKMVHSGFSRPIDALLASESGKRLSSMGLTSDIALCAKMDLLKDVVIATKEDGQYVVSHQKEDE
jgi:2-phosphosulfolactate phosphatase